MNPISSWKACASCTGETGDDDSFFSLMSDQSQYFQTIARKFLERRGAPLFLSSQELALIARWEKAGIPLRVVLEGIQFAFESRRNQGQTKRKGRTLAFCEPHIKEAFAMHRERTVGRKSVQGRKNERKRAIEESINGFLRRLPSEATWLEAPFRKILTGLSGLTEDDLERAEEEVDALLLEHVSAGDKEIVKDAVTADFPEAADGEYHRLFRIQLIKHLREKYKIPHVAPYYY